jgi:HK97 gp10 family phage protein
LAVEIRVEGLAELRKAFRKIGDTDSLAEVRDGLKKAAGIVANEAQSRVPVRSGAARASIRATAAGNKAYVVGGKARVPYYGWLDFGSRRPVSGNPRSRGPWSGSGVGPPKGRFIYAAIDAKERQVADAVGDALEAALRRF